MYKQVEVVFRAVDEIARHDDPAEVLGTLARVVLSTFGPGAIVETTLLPVTPLLAHLERGRIEAARAVCGASPMRDSPLVQQAIESGAAFSSRFVGRLAADEDPLVRVSGVFDTEVVTVVPLGPKALGFLSVFGGALPRESLRLLQILATAAASVLERVVAERRTLDEVRVRDVSIAMLSALVEQRPIPWLLIDRRRLLVGWNTSFAELWTPRRGCPVSELPEGLRPIIEDVFAGGEPGVTEVSLSREQWMLVGAHPVMVDGAIGGVGLSLLDVSASRSAERAARRLLDCVQRLHATRSLAAAFDELARMAVESFGGWAVCCPVERALQASGPADAACLELARIVSSRVRSVPLVVTADELALMSLKDARIVAALERHAQTTLLVIPIAEAGASIGRGALCVGRRGAEFSLAELMFAGDLAKVVARAFALLAAQDEDSARSLLFDDFLDHVAGELSDRLTEVSMQWFVAERRGLADTDNLQRSIGRMCASVHGLLSVAPRSRPMTGSAVDLSELVRSLVVVLRAPSLVHIEPQALVSIDAPSLRDALSGVLGFVLGAAAPDDLVCVRVERVGREWTVTVSHAGRGYRDLDARRALDAFWHGDGRSRALAVARAVFASHGGRSWIETAEDSGAAYSFALPALDQLGDRGQEQLAVERLEEEGGGAERVGVDAAVAGRDDGRDGAEARVGAL